MKFLRELKLQDVIKYNLYMGAHNEVFIVYLMNDLYYALLTKGNR